MVLERFVEGFEMEDSDWIVKLGFLSDITTHVNGLHLRLKGA